MNYANGCAAFVREPARIPIVFDYEGVTFRGMAEGFEGAECSVREFCDRKEYTYSALHSRSGARFTVQMSHWEKRGAFSCRAEITAEGRTGVFGHPHWELEIPAPNAVLVGNKGDDANGGIGYAPYSCALSGGAVHSEITGGRPTHGCFPYYGIDSDAGGLILVLSWQGCWYTDFSQSGDSVIFSGGQAGLETYLEPGETLRMPLLLLLDYEQDRVNTWRRFYIDCLMPRPGGRLTPPALSVFNGSCNGLSEKLVADTKRWYDENEIDYDLWWFDAGWGADGTGEHNPTGEWIYAANLTVNTDAFPDGMAWLGRELREQRRQLMLWFEAEVVRTPECKREEFFTYYPDFKPEWFLGQSGKEWCGLQLVWQLMDLGNPELLQWLERHIFAVMDKAGADIFRIDFNIDPAELWRLHDRPGRTGITENKYCQGYLRMIKDISLRYGCLMDSCASGGGRNDLETMCLMLPLHYSDHIDVAPLNSNEHVFMQQNVWCWFPYTHNNFSAADQISDRYTARSIYNPCLTCGMSAAEREKVSVPGLKAAIEEWRSICDMYYGDYYELLPPSADDTSAKAFEFYDAAQGRGFVQIFMPQNCSGTVAVELKGADGFEVRDADGAATELSGTRLTMPAAPGTARLIYITAASDKHL